MNDSTASPAASPEPEETERRPAFWRSLGPGLVTGASDDDPSGIATSSQVGTQFGFGLLWTMLFSYPLMTSAQEISARIGRVTRHGLAGNTRRHLPAGVLYAVTLVLVVVNTINLGADIGAMGTTLHLVAGGSALLYAALFALLSAGLRVFVPYTRDVRVLKWLTVRLFASVATVFVVRIPWGEALRATVWPRLALGTGALKGLIAVLGTTISPYLFFRQASQEVEEVHAHGGEERLRRAPDQAEAQFRRIQIDTSLGLAFSNLVAFFIILTAAVTLHASGRTDIQTAAQAAEALRPVAGQLAFSLFALGIIGTGLLAVPVLAGSVAYAVPSPRRGFYGVLVAATLLGRALNLLGFDPLRALDWAASINGVAAAPVMALMTLLATLGVFLTWGR